MGEVIDIADRLACRRDRRERMSRDQRIKLVVARRYVQVTEQEMLRQLDIIDDDASTPLQVEEASSALPLLEILLRERQSYLKRLENELLDRDHDG